MNRVVLFMLLLAFWLLLTWPDGGPGPAWWQDVAVGVIATLLVTLVVGGRAGENAARWVEPSRWFWAVVYFFVLTGSVVKANLEVACRVLHPQMPIRPGIVKVKTRLTGAAARTLLGNSITLCPGTLAVDVRNDGTIMVHWIYVRSADEAEATEEIIGRFESYIARILE
mgnify:CR=1 FL=1